MRRLAFSLDNGLGQRERFENFNWFKSTTAVRVAGQVPSSLAADPQDEGSTHGVLDDLPANLRK
jgi:hypothetical protein